MEQHFTKFATRSAAHNSSKGRLRTKAFSLTVDKSKQEKRFIQSRNIYRNFSTRVKYSYKKLHIDRMRFKFAVSQRLQEYHNSIFTEKCTA